ncbi:MAG: GAF domain-containing protein, partial [Chitinophagaceae bacterium]
QDTLYNFRYVTTAVQDTPRKLLWLEANEGELHAYDYITGKSEQHTYTGDRAVNIINAISVDPKGILWLATNNGLFAYDPVTRKAKLHRLPTATQNIYNVETKDGETVWATTANDVVRLQVVTDKFTSFNLSSLLPHVVTYQRSLYVDEMNDAWIGSSKGFSIINNAAFRPLTTVSVPHLINFKVFDKPKLFDQPYFNLSHIELNHNENFFSFDFSALDFNQAGSMQYAYRLVPFDKDWKVSDKNAASYTNVPPGEYQLLLRAQYGLGNWKEAQPISVHIRAPYWQRWWFIALLAIAFSFGIYFLFRFREKRKEEKRMDETIDYFANSQYGENSVTEICWDIARNCISQLKLEDCVVYLLDEKENVLVQKAAYGPKNPREHEIINPIDIPVGDGIVGTAAATGKPVIVRDTTKDRRYIVDDQSRMSELAVPIIHEGKAIGVIDSEHSKRNFFGDEHVKVLSTIAAISANKIAEAKAEEAAKESQIQLLEIKKL